MTGNLDQADAFDAWKSMMDWELDEFTTDDVLLLDDEEFTVDSLDKVERALLDRFDDIPDIDRDEQSRQFYWRVVRYVGETFVRNFGGRWADSNDIDPEYEPSGPVVVFPFSDLPETVMTTVTAAIDRRRGTYFREIAEWLGEDMAASQPPGNAG